MTFVPSKTWLGEKKGYYFGTGIEGTGYYLDSLQQSLAQNESPRKRKRVTIAEDQNEMKLLIEDLEKKASGSSILELSKKGVLAASRSLENTYQENIQKRTEQNPELYMDSEVALYEQLVALQSLATDTQVYGYIESSNLMTTLIQLLSHENGGEQHSCSNDVVSSRYSRKRISNKTNFSHIFRNAHSTSMNYFNEKDICASVVSLLKEWIDPSLVAENPSVLPILKNFAALAMEGWETIVLNLQRYQRDDDSQDNTLKG